MFFFSSLFSDVLRSDLAQKAIEIGIEPSVVERTILMKMSRTGSGFSSVEALVEGCLENTPESYSDQTQEQGNAHPMKQIHSIKRHRSSSDFFYFLFQTLHRTNYDLNIMKRLNLKCPNNIKIFE